MRLPVPIPTVPAPAVKEEALGDLVASTAEMGVKPGARKNKAKMPLVIRRSRCFSRPSPRLLSLARLQQGWESRRRAAASGCSLVRTLTGRLGPRQIYKKRCPGERMLMLGTKLIVQVASDVYKAAQGWRFGVLRIQQ
ncbi:uncharacterized protein LOC119305788 [Triticum dicoccoides]|uniref:uncharacterized protein LOC119305788 n=1 Tax=Triticum dicoccoides TaxID=85692 RepID=UPI00188EA3ED|nr:uncharacterized protein LOC119305788 [Triticum dicoccoides]